MNVNSGQVNVFGGRAGSGVNPNLLSNLIINMNQKFVSKQEAEEKYLDQTEGDKLYINEPITENIDMKDKKKILQVQFHLILTTYLINTMWMNQYGVLLLTILEKSMTG